MVRRHRRSTAFEATATVVATICCLPCICLIGSAIVAKDLFIKVRRYERPKTRRARESKERKKSMMRSTPKRVGPRLERHLTIGRPEPEEKYEKVDSEDNKTDVEVAKLSRTMTVTDRQEDSGIFKLPLEIRRKIYEEALGGYAIHICFVEAYRRMSHTRCKGQPGQKPRICRRTSCKKLSKVPGVPEQWGNISLLSLLQSCRMIYSEAIDILYTENTFHFESLNDVLKLSLTLIPERMHLIKSLQWKPTISSTNSLYDTPWLDCRKPSTCCCITCWPEAIGLDEAQINGLQFSTFEYPLPKAGWRICLESYE